MYTTHGYHFSGDKIIPPPKRARCGGPKICKTCSFEVQVQTDIQKYKMPQYEAEKK